MTLQKKWKKKKGQEGTRDTKCIYSRQISNTTILTTGPSIQVRPVVLDGSSRAKSSGDDDTIAVLVPPDVFVSILRLPIDCILLLSFILHAGCRCQDAPQSCTEPGVPQRPQPGHPKNAKGYTARYSTSSCSSFL